VNPVAAADTWPLNVVHPSTTTAASRRAPRCRLRGRDDAVAGGQELAGG